MENKTIVMNGFEIEIDCYEESFSGDYENDYCSKFEISQLEEILVEEFGKGFCEFNWWINSRGINCLKIGFQFKVDNTPIK